MSKFDPTRHFMNLKGKQYLPVAARIQWFREEHPDWGIITSHEVLDTVAGEAVFRASILNSEGRIIATATKLETRKDFPDFAEKAETGCIGRALAICGYGTQFAQELEEGARIVDTPQPPESRGDQRAAAAVQRQEKRSYAQEAGAEPKEPNPRNRYFALLKEHGCDGLPDPVRRLFNGLILGKNKPYPTKDFTPQQWSVFLKRLESHCQDCAGGELCDARMAAQDAAGPEVPEAVNGYVTGTL